MLAYKKTIGSLIKQATKTKYDWSVKRHASVANVRFIQSKASIDRQVLNRYKAKLEAKAKQEGVEDPSELKEKYKDRIESIKKELNKIDPLKELEDYEKAQQFKSSLKKSAKERGPIDTSEPEEPYKTLDSYLKLDKLAGLEPNEIEFLWRARFQNQEKSLIAVVPGETFSRLYKNARLNPTFVLPLPRADAEVDDDLSGDKSKVPMEIHYTQWSFVGPNTVHVLITSLAEYKLHKEYARPHTTIAFHLDLLEKGIVLMNGQVEKDANITLLESQLLLLNLQRFYGALSEETEMAQKRLRLVKAFNDGSSDFSMEECIELSQSLEN